MHKRCFVQKEKSPHICEGFYVFTGLTSYEPVRNALVLETYSKLLVFVGNFEFGTVK